jgi:acetate kinase
MLVPIGDVVCEDIGRGPVAARPGAAIGTARRIAPVKWLVHCPGSLRGYAMIDTLLVLNTGSSSLKFQVFAYDSLDVLLAGKVTGIGGAATLSARFGDPVENYRQAVGGNDHDSALRAVVALIEKHGGDRKIDAVVHRIVHGGPKFVEPVIITSAILAELEALDPLAPLHQPHNLAGVIAARHFASDAPNIGCFDTGFHAGHAEILTTFAISQDLRDKGIRRYGFHGLSYEWIARELEEQHPELHRGRVVVGHLGNGASLCGLKGGVSIDTTMSMTALDGLPMGTRSGAIDPGAILFMLRDLGFDIDRLERALYDEAGLQGLSGISNDVETLLASPDPRAAFAIEHFALKAAQYAAMMAVSMGGMDAFVFTGGIGEHAAPVRNAILAHLAFLGDFKVLVIPANEERMMAIKAKKLLAA